MCPFAPLLWASLRDGRRIRRWLLRQGLRTRPSFSPPSHSRCLSPALARLCQLLALGGFTRPKRYSIVSDFATWNFSKISFCSSVKVFSKSSWCLAIYPSSSFISFKLVLISSWGMMFPCHSSFNKTTEHKPKRLVKRHNLFCRIAMRPVFCQRPCEEIFDFLRRSHQFAP